MKRRCGPVDSSSGMELISNSLPHGNQRLDTTPEIIIDFPCFLLCHRTSTRGNRAWKAIVFYLRISSKNTWTSWLPPLSIRYCGPSLVRPLLHPRSTLYGKLRAVCLVVFSEYCLGTDKSINCHIAILPSAKTSNQRPLWSRQIEKS